MLELVKAPCFALRRCGRRWSVLVRCDDPRGPSWRVVDVLDEPSSTSSRLGLLPSSVGSHGKHAACDHDAPSSLEGKA
jgi:hypothetical protein